MQNYRVILSVVYFGFLSAGSHWAAGATIYVDNRLGSDSLDGSTEVVAGGGMGPVTTIRRALELAKPGDTISLADRGVPYYESVALVGSRHSGISRVGPLSILGHGAVISGARPVPTTAWKRVEETLWRFTPWRKGHYLLLSDVGPVPEQPCPAGAKTVPDVAAGHWCAWRGSIYYRATLDEAPSEMEFSYAALGVGLTLYNVHGVRITDVTFRHFRLDGVNAHDLCHDVVLENVTSLENGRAGVCVAGTSDIIVRHSKLLENREHSLLVQERAAAALDQTEINQPPTIQE